MQNIILDFQTYPDSYEIRYKLSHLNLIADLIFMLLGKFYKIYFLAVIMKKN